MRKFAGMKPAGRWIAGIVMVACSLAPAPGLCDDRENSIYGTHGSAPGPRFANWAGVDVLAKSASAYGGMSYAIDGTLDQPGWRLRVSGGMGRYSYTRGFIGSRGPERRKFSGDNAFADVLVGYQFQFDRTTLKVFAGGDSEHHFIDPDDPLARARGTAYGAKVAADVWHWFTPELWGAVNGSYATTFDTFKVEARTGYRVTESMDLGIETRIEGNADYDAGRAGGFATVHLGNTAIRAAAGVSGDRSMKTSPYATLSVFLRY